MVRILEPFRTVSIPDIVFGTDHGCHGNTSCIPRHRFPKKGRDFI